MTYSAPPTLTEALAELARLTEAHPGQVAPRPPSWDPVEGILRAVVRSRLPGLRWGRTPTPYPEDGEEWWAEPVEGLRLVWYSPLP